MRIIFLLEKMFYIYGIINEFLMKRLVVSFLLILFSCFSYGQVPEPAIQFLHVIGGNGVDAVLSDITKTNDDGFIVAYESLSSTGPITTEFCNGYTDRTIFAKYNADASVLEWSKCSANGSFIYPQSDGSFIFGGEATSVPASWAFEISKESASGTNLWRKTYGGDTASARLKDMIATSDGGYIMIGETNYSDTDFTIHYGSWADDDIAIIKIDNNGNKIWSKVIGGSGEDMAAAIVAAPGDGCYIIGTTYSNDHDFASNHGGDDAFVVRLDNGGGIVWVRDIGGSGGEYAACAYPDGKGGTILGGASNSTDGDRTHFPTYGCPIWALDLDSSGHVLWDNCYGGGGGNCYAQAICKAADGSIWIAGVSSLNGNEVDTNYGSDDAWFVHADSIGNFINARVLGSYWQDKGTMIFPLSNGNVVAGGYYNSASGSLSGLPYYGSTDAFLTVLAPWNQTAVPMITNSTNKIKIYPNPCGEKVFIEKTDQTQNFRISITDVLGRLLYERVLNDKLQVTMEGWARGIYCVQTTTVDGYKEVQKLVVQ